MRFYFRIKYKFYYCFYIFVSLLILFFACGCKKESTPQKLKIIGKVELDDESLYPVIVGISNSPYITISDEEGNFSFYLNKKDIVNKSDIYVYVKNKMYMIYTLKAPEFYTSIVNIGSVKIDIPTSDQLEKKQIGKLYGRVILSDNSSPEGICVNIYPAGFTTFTDKNGYYFFYNISLENKNLKLAFYKENFEFYEKLLPQLFPAKEYKVGDVILRKKSIKNEVKYGSIKGKVVLLSEGKPIKYKNGIRVELTDMHKYTFTDKNGDFEIYNVPYGTHFILVSFSGFSSYQTSFYLDKEKLTIPLIKLEEEKITHYGTVKGSVIIPEKAPDYILVGLNGTDKLAFVNNDGKFELKNIIPGVYDFIVKAENYKTVIIKNVMVKPGIVTNIPSITLEEFKDLPKIVSTIPYNGKKNVPILKENKIFVLFNRKMKIYPTKKAVSIYPPVKFETFLGKEHLQSDWDTLLILIKNNDSSSLRFETTYTVTISHIATDLEGNQMLKDYTFSFTTGKGRIISTIPKNGQKYVGVKDYNSISIKFNCKIDEDSFIDSFSIRPEPEDNITFDFEESDEGWTIAKANVSLKTNEEYTVIISSSVKSWDGVDIENTPYEFHFATYSSKPRF